MAKKYLDGELKKYDSWEALNKNIKRLVDKFNFEKVKAKGVGQTTILKFLGGNWKQLRSESGSNIKANNSNTSLLGFKSKRGYRVGGEIIIEYTRYLQRGPYYQKSTKQKKSE